MRNFDHPSEFIIDLANTVVIEMRSSHPDWEEAFVRMQAGVGFFEVKCAYVLPSSTEILNVLAHKSFISRVQQIAPLLRAALPHAGVPFCVAILRVGADMNYEMQYEYKDEERWRISKMNGGTGLPVGYVPA